jgi:hypothetical protein
MTFYSAAGRKTFLGVVLALCMLLGWLAAPISARGYDPPPPSGDCLKQEGCCADAYGGCGWRASECPYNNCRWEFCYGVPGICPGSEDGYTDLCTDLSCEYTLCPGGCWIY